MPAKPEFWGFTGALKCRGLVPDLPKCGCGRTLNAPRNTVYNRSGLCKSCIMRRRWAKQRGGVK